MSETPQRNEKSNFLSMGFRLKPIDPDKEQETVADDNPQEAPQDCFRRIGDQFSTKLLLLWTYIREIGSVANATTFTNMASALALTFEVIDSAKQQSASTIPLAEVEFEIRAGDTENPADTLRLTEKVYEPRHLKSLQEYTQFHDAALRILHESALQQIVNAYERLIGDLIRWHLTYDPEAAPKDQTITYRELLQIETMDEAKRRVVQTVLSDFLRTKSAPQQLEYFREHFNADVKNHFPKMAEFEELILRRHTLVHAGGLITPEYLRRVRALKNLPYQPGTEGSIVELDRPYIESAWSIVYSLGTILLHLVAQQCARNRKRPDEEDQADFFVLHYPFKAIQERLYAAAEMILNYAKPLRLAKTTNDLMVKINLAQTLKWQQREDEAKALLQTVDWKATSNLFRTCVAALRDPDEFGDLLTAAVRDKDLSRESLYEWPVFTEVRKDSRFPEWVQQAFGGPDSPANERFPPSLLNFEHEAKLKEIMNYFKSRADAQLESRELTTITQEHVPSIAKQEQNNSEPQPDANTTSDK
jgi:hypothetical protein